MVNTRQTPENLTWGLIFVSTLLHLVVSGVGLGADEAHYALYGYNLDWSYFDHPPMVGWLQAIILPFSESNFALRLIPTVLFIATSWVLYRLVLDLFPHHSEWLGFFSVAYYHSGLMLQLIGFSMLPESPLLLFSLLVVWRFYHLIESNKAQDWILLGLFVGLAGLSKYTAITLVFSLIFLMLWEKKIEFLKNWNFYLALLIAVILIMPVLYWNNIHDWSSFKYQIDHGTGSSSWEFENWLITLIVQLVVYSPGIFVIGLIAIFSSIRQFDHRGFRFLIAFALPVFILFGWSSGYEKGLPHWTALFWVLVGPLAIAWIMRYWKASRLVRGFCYFSILYSVVVNILVFSQMYNSWMPLEVDKNFVRGMYGWQGAASEAERLSGLQNNEKVAETILFSTHWTFASRLAWYARPITVKVLDNRDDQFDIWYGSSNIGDSGILVVPYEAKDDSEVSLIQARFESCALVGDYQEKRINRVVNSFDFIYCKNLLK